MVEWYKYGGIMTKPTMFGFNGMNAMIGGEAGPEAILPISNLKQYIREEMGSFNINYDMITQSFISAIIQTGIDNPKFDVDGYNLFKVISPHIGRSTRGY